MGWRRRWASRSIRRPRTFPGRTTRLIEDTYEQNGCRPVPLVGHSNGPLYAQYLITHTSREWREKYIQGFTPIAGNFPGQGSLYSLIFSGLTITDFSLPTDPTEARASAHMLLLNPSTYMSPADPAIFDRHEVVLQNSTTVREYAPSDYRKLLADAGLELVRPIADHYIAAAELGARGMREELAVFPSTTGVPPLESQTYDFQHPVHLSLIRSSTRCSSWVGRSGSAVGLRNGPLGSPVAPWGCPRSSQRPPRVPRSMNKLTPTRLGSRRAAASDGQRRCPVPAVVSPCSISLGPGGYSPVCESRSSTLPKGLRRRGNQRLLGRAL